MKQITAILFLLSFLSSTVFSDLLTKEKQKYQAQGVAVVIIDSTTGKIKFEVSSETLSPKKLTREYLFEPGNAMIPISFALLLDKNSQWANKKVLNCKEADMKKGDCKGSYAQDAIIYSSSKVMDILSPNLKAEELYKGLKKFGFTHTPSLNKLQQDRYKQLCARGYGFRTNLLELTRAYIIFSNPKLIIKEQTAKQIQKLLIEALEKGTGKNAQIKGILIGGKTATARMISKKNKRYTNHYNATFIGFANGRKNRYTIGVLVIDPKAGKLSSETAAKVFKDVVKSLIYKNQMLKTRIPVEEKIFNFAKKSYNNGEYKKAATLYERSCNSGNKIACYNLAIMCINGQGMKQDENKIKNYYRKSCKLGFDLACMTYKDIFE